MGGYAGAGLLIFGLTLLNGGFAAAEIALISARRATLRADADRGSKGAATALRLVEEPSRMLSSVQVGITLVGFASSAVGAVTLATPLADWLRSLGPGWLSASAGPASVALVTLAVAYLNIVVGELVPKRLGLQRSERVARITAVPVSFVAAAFAPVTWLLVKSSDLVGLLAGVRPGVGRPGVTEEEIKLLVTEQGTLLEEEKRMIREVFELGDTVVREVMVPRVDTVMLADSSSLEDAIALFVRSGFSRLPVYHGDPDRVVGVVLLKDLLGDAAACRLGGRPVTEGMREPMFVPETKRILQLLSEMRSTRTHLAVVVDEHGGTAGMVTMEDIVEEVVGEIVDEFDPERRLIAEIGEGRWSIDGGLSVEEAVETLGLPLRESEEYETVAGWVLAELGRIPVPGESLVHEGYEYRVQAVRRRRISRLQVTRLPGGETG